MSKINIKSISRRAAYALIGATTLFAYLPGVASASPITARSVTIGSSIANATTTYNFAFTTASATDIQGITFEACTAASGACTTPDAFSASSSTLSGQTGLGSTGTWVVDTSTAGKLAIHNATADTSAGAVTVDFAGVHNPSDTNATFYIRISTWASYSGGNYTSLIDDGVVATSTAGQVTVNATIDETLTFTLGTTSIDLTGITPSTSGTDDTSTMIVGTNADSGYSVTYSGTTLTSGANTIPAMAGGNFSAGTAGFGMNLAANASSLGTAPSGGSGIASTGYDTADSFKFNVAGEKIAEASGPTTNTTYTFSYVANIDSATPAGQYSTDITYTATANF